MKRRAAVIATWGGIASMIIAIAITIFDPTRSLLAKGFQLVAFGVVTALCIHFLRSENGS